MFLGMAQASDTKADLLTKARLAEEAERYADMVQPLKDIAKLGPLSLEEREKLHTTYKNLVGERRDSYKKVQAVSKVSQDKKDAYLAVIAKEGT